ncbi:patatin-like phospholipase family protein [Pedobacter jejuensis]|uniref:Patatin-like phospholipase family protein n=1 Tax=Pedobacter jejuensis TaxID=1268550 RepID=A0A3N0BS21_9SPHI|nr:patatin-like phospholipase family protein [Pedobacter jejuensis]RNL51821.1 patatin-like phospholipase family protein [Pedobacter jejuensis]
MIKILTFIFGPIVNAILEIHQERKALEEKLEFKSAFKDFFHVARNTGFVLIPSLLCGAVFLLLSQGRDTLLLIVEKMDSGDYSQLFCFLIGITAWSIFGELSIRYAIAISDNSGKSLRDSRVYSRKISQRILATFSLFWPSIMILLALIWGYNSATYMSWEVKLLNFGIFALCIFLLLRLFSYLYFHRKPRIGNKPAKTILGARSLGETEYNWVNRLYGIYDEYVYTLLKPSNFKGAYSADMRHFTKHIVDSSDEFRADFLQNKAVMTSQRLIPEKFELINGDKIIPRRGDSYRWRYRIPNSFYPKLHRQIGVMAGLSIIMLIGISFLPGGSSFFGHMGAPALICIAFACYSGIYSALLFVDYALLRKSFFQVRWLLIILLVVSSVVNKDHPVDMDAVANAPRNTLTNQFETWFADYRKKMNSKHPGIERYPVVFICAEGGALRTGAYTSMFLTNLQNDLNNKGIDFKKSIFSMSGVSGGALGLAYYNAKAFGDDQKNAKAGGDISKAVSFYKYDCLSPIIGKMLFGDFVNLFIPWHIKNFDRAIALEKSWKKAYAKTLQNGERNLFSEPFIDGKLDTLKPVLIINTTEIESGYQCWVSNIQPQGIFYQQKRDILQQKVNRISYSTAINFSTRFPLFSPAAEVDTLGGRLHYLDGGYVENTGAGSTIELLNLLEKQVADFNKVLPVVIYLRFSDNDNTQAKNIHIGNELVEIVSGIYNTRVGRSFTAIAMLNKFVNDHNGIIIDEPLTKNERAVPMNWVLSDQSMDYIFADIKTKLLDTSSNGVKIKLASKGAKYLPISPYP